jgi:hypothetical protein
VRQNCGDVEVTGTSVAFMQDRAAWVAEREEWRIRHADLDAQHQVLAARWAALRAERAILSQQDYQERRQALGAAQCQWLAAVRRRGGLAARLQAGGLGRPPRPRACSHPQPAHWLLHAHAMVPREVRLMTAWSQLTQVIEPVLRLRSPANSQS